MAPYKDLAKGRDKPPPKRESHAVRKDLTKYTRDGCRGSLRWAFRCRCLPFATLAVASGIIGSALVAGILGASVGFHHSRYLQNQPSPFINQQAWNPAASKPTYGAEANCSVSGSGSCTPRPAGLAASVEEEEKQEAWKQVHSVDDDDDKVLMELAAAAADSNPAAECDIGRKQKKKMAFMFLAARGLPLRQLWERFFKGHDGLFNIYIHAAPDYREQPRESSVFYGRRIPSKHVKWGRVSMMDAERRLLARALLDDPCNDRFILLSDSCIPLYNFTMVYRLLVELSPPSHVGSFDDPHRVGRGRYNPLMYPLVSLSDWRKGSQWFEVHRNVAAMLVSDRKYYPLFRTHCLSPCYVDEHYIPTLITKVASKLNSGRSITWADWSKGGAHPRMFRGNDVSKWLLNAIRRAPCRDDNATGSCFLFARKFDRSCLGPLLKVAPKFMGFNH